MSEVRARCAYESDGIRCLKPGYKGPFCKAHTPRNPRMVKLDCPSCSAVGLGHDEIGQPYLCSRCGGRGRLDVPAVVARRGQR